MSLYSNIKKILNSNIRVNLSLSDEKAWNPSLWNLVGSQSVSGEVVNEHTALTYSAVWDAVGQIAGTISTLPLHLLRTDANKTIQASDKRLFRVMHSEFNPWMAAQIGREVMLSHILLWGNCYAEKVRNGYGEITQLWPIAPNRVRMAMEEGELIYYIRVGSQDIPLTRDQILHIPGLGFDGFQGYSVIAMARKSLGLGMTLETFGALYFGQGTHPGLVVSHPSKLSPETRGNLESALNMQYSGLGNSNRLMLLDDGLKPEKIGIPPNDSQFIESRTFQISDVARWFHIPLHKLKELARATNNNIESEQASYYIDCVLPWLVRFEQSFDMQLLSEPEKWKQNCYFRHNVDGLLRANTAVRANYYKTMASIGGMTINDIRRKENMDPFPDAYADEPFIAINNMIPLSKVDEFLANQKQKSTQPSQPTPDSKEATNANLP